MPAYPEATTGFQPLFLYESLSGLIGVITLLWIARRFGSRMRPGDLFLIFLIWYAAVRFDPREPARRTTGPSSGSRRPR